MFDLLRISYRIGAVVQLVRIPACHAGGRGFESRPLRQHNEASAEMLGLFCICSLPNLLIKNMNKRKTMYQLMISDLDGTL
ncbi:hypothetical protein PBPRB1578 [Photobacterium profundum SS9]|uniref:Uncharacterized protein n=1 Tax=Photobacterium profundum (strain SS9) TaxID=298386 RepID=Q6LGZ0_PHOPR|nr:hypothetical protein PBPRB1578 [Photobacterium profundum SS9]